MLQDPRGHCPPKGVPYSILVPQSFAWTLLTKAQVPNLQIFSEKLLAFSDQHHKELCKDLTLPTNPKLETTHLQIYLSCINHVSGTQMKSRPWVLPLNKISLKDSPTNKGKICSYLWLKKNTENLKCLLSIVHYVTVLEDTGSIS